MPGSASVLLLLLQLASLLVMTARAWFVVCLQLEAALVIDGVNVLVQGLRAKMDVDEHDSWRGTFRRGQVYNDGSPGIQSRGSSVVVGDGVVEVEDRSTVTAVPAFSPVALVS